MIATAERRGENAARGQLLGLSEIGKAAGAVDPIRSASNLCLGTEK